MSGTPQASNGDPALIAAITGLKEDMERLKNDLQTETARTLADQIQRLRNVHQSLETHFNVNRDSGDATLGMPSTTNYAIRPGTPKQALKELNTLIGKPESLNPIVEMLEKMVKALETLKNHLETARG